MHKGKLVMYDVCVRKDSYVVSNEREYSHEQFYGTPPKDDTHTHYSQIRKAFLAKL
jgi:hypothetical protein